MPSLDDEIARHLAEAAASGEPRGARGYGRPLADDEGWNATPEALRMPLKNLQHWSRWYTGWQAPFTWEPDQVEVLAGGTLAHSSGPVRSPQGKVVARFNSVWRLEPDGQWRVVFDKGSPACDCEAK